MFSFFEPLIKQELTRDAKIIPNLFFDPIPVGTARNDFPVGLTPHPPMFLTHMTISFVQAPPHQPFESERAIVSFRSCVPTRGLVA